MGLRFRKSISIMPGIKLNYGKTGMSISAGVPAIDNEGYIYYNDTEKGSLVKLEPATGKAIASLQLGTELKSSPTISADGTIYVTGMLEGKPTLFAVEGAATGYAANAWSQMGGNPGKNGYMY